MSQEQLDKYFKDSIELIFNNSKDYFKDDEMTKDEYCTYIGDILKTFVNKFHTYQSQFLFSSISNVNLNFKKDEIILDKTYFDTTSILNNSSIQEELKSIIVDDKPGLYPSISNLPGFNINDIIKQHQNDIDKESEESTGYYSSEPEFETQCCTRIGNELFKIDEYSSEFLDKYPAGVFITKEGYVVGKPCHNMIPDDEFDKGAIFCEQHIMTGYLDDIREPVDYLNDYT